MAGKEKNAKEQSDSTVKTVMEKAKTTKGKVIIGVVVLVILMLNISWTLANNKISTEIQAVRAEIAELAARFEEVTKAGQKESAINDYDAIKAEIQALQENLKTREDSAQKAAEDFNAKLNAVIKSEEAKLDILVKELEKQTESQKAYLEELKSLAIGNTEK